MKIAGSNFPANNILFKIHLLSPQILLSLVAIIFNFTIRRSFKMRDIFEKHRETKQKKNA